MEISFEEKSLKYYRRVCDTALSHEETMEIIVPDAMPDAAAVIDADGVVLLRSKEAANGRFTVSGVGDICVIYRPEDGSGPRRLSVQLPFSVSGECAELTNMGRLTASCRLVSAEARLLNSRKALVKAEVCVAVTAYMQETLVYKAPAPEKNNYKKYNMQLLEKSRVLRTAADVTEKSFGIGEDFALPSSKPPLGAALRSRLRLNVEEAGCLGGKLIIKGSACIALVYSSASGGDVACADFKTPFSVILELDWDDDDLKFDIAVMATAYTANENSGGGLSVEIGAVAQAAVWRKCGISYIADAYSTDYETELETRLASIETLADKAVQNDALRLIIETPKQPRAIIDAAAYLGKTRMEGGAAKIPVAAKILCLAEDGSLFAASVRGEASKAEDQKGAKITAELGELFSSPMAAGVEIRAPLAYSISRYKTDDINLTVSASVKEEAPKNKTDLPSIIVFRAAENDSLWEIGKRYGTTRELIRAANGLGEDSEVAAGDLVLVAKQR